ncbi:hypothetical protein K431DRAFT_338197 [Polychaeton citri CBS 116435]|uniref:PXA domain-containing protein n=1 Tax=Polychaeton citri CBS 116435 TaxID=1314669 RepID=A0A9P4URU1_9PEZI|nr:hypothetical protein K431DRAFT_338197 [Polychaeton citri CBS 116435]
MDEPANPRAAHHGDETTTTKPAEVEDSIAQQPTTDRQTLSATISSLTDKALHFLSHASNETLGACLVGLGATTYVIFGRVGLVVIGVAGGVVLHATWDGTRGDYRDEVTRLAEAERRKETGLDVAQRLLNWRMELDGGGQASERVALLASQRMDFSIFETETQSSLDAFADAVVKDYVKYWYTPQIPSDTTFPESCKGTLVAFIISLSAHLQRKRPADALLDFVTNASSIILVFLSELSAALHASPYSKPKDAISLYLEHKPDSNLANVLDEEHQRHKLDLVAEDILQAYLDPKAYNCEPVHVFLKEVLAKLVLGYTMEMCSKPEWINDWIVYGLEESETAKEVMDIVDAGVEGGATEPSTRVLEPEEPQIKQEVEGVAGPDHVNPGNHKRQVSRAEEAMDEAMLEAQRLTQLMIEDDERRAREEREQHAVGASSGEDVSDTTISTQGAPTPTSSQSEKDRQSQDGLSVSEQSPSQISDVADPQKQLVTPTTPQFTSFDQLVPRAQPTALAVSPDKARTSPPVLTLYKANISVFDDSDPADRLTLKAKPNTDYMIQIEPASSAFPGWMIARKYADFETLHEVLRRISVITGTRFGDTHAELPRWKTNTKNGLRLELERYLSDAVRHQSLAESEGMKRFLEKDQGRLGGRSPGEKKGFGWPTPDAFGKFGGDMMNVLTTAPQGLGKGVAGGGKAIFGGVAGLVGGKKVNQSSSNLSRASTSSTTTLDGASNSGHQSRLSMGQLGATDTYLGSMSVPRYSQESLRAVPQQALERRASTKSNTTTSSADFKNGSTTTLSKQSSEFGRPDMTSPTSPHLPVPETPTSPSTAGVEETFNLPPPPHAISDDYGSPQRRQQSVESSRPTVNPAEPIASAAGKSVPIQIRSPTKATEPRPKAKSKSPLTEQETSVAIELVFTIISEVYNLSSAWQIRRTLLIAAKNFLLRPGNPQLQSIQSLLQSSLLDNNLSDAGLAAHVLNLRKNALPTEAEMEAWKRDCPERTPEQKEELRLKARELLIKKGMPQALTSVMGAAASGEALGKVFDCLQVERVSRGLVFGLMLQALKVITH